MKLMGNTWGFPMCSLVFSIHENHGLETQVSTGFPYGILGESMLRRRRYFEDELEEDKQLLQFPPGRWGAKEISPTEMMR